jgi:hypothetical protein
MPGKGVAVGEDLVDGVYLPLAVAGRRARTERVSRASLLCLMTRSQSMWFPIKNKTGTLMAR